MFRKERRCIAELSDKILLKEFQEICFPKEQYIYNDNQYVGCGYDALVSFYRCEIKNDQESQRTGNFFVETTQTFDYWKTSHKSGLVLSLKQAELFIMVGYQDKTSWFYWASPQEWRNLCRNRPMVETRVGIKGNKPG